MAVTITVWSNDGDGQKVTVTLSAAPSGTPTFFLAEAPEDLTGGAGAYGPSATALDPADVVSLGGNQYRLTLIDAADVHTLPWPWWLKVTDDDGEATEAPTWQETALRNHVAVVVSQQNKTAPDMPGVLVLEWLALTLNRNRKALDAALHGAGYTSAEVKAIQVGLPEQVQSAPYVMVQPESYEVQEEGALRFDFGVYRFSIGIILRVPDPRPETKPGMAVAEMAFLILRRECYRDVVLDCGLTIVDGSPQRWSVGEWLDPETEDRYTRVVLDWRGRLGVTIY